MRLTCIGHSGFALEAHGVTLVFDYYTDQCGVMPAIVGRARRMVVMVSHSHPDHLNPDIFKWVATGKVERYVVSAESRRKLRRIKGLDLDALPITFMHHDQDTLCPLSGVQIHSFGSTDIGVSYLATLPGGELVMHAGDLNDWHWSDESTPQEVKKADGDFRAILRTIAARAPHMQLAMFPIDPNMGTDFARGAREFLQAVQVDHFVPMHMWGRDSEATQFGLYRNPAHGECHYVPAGTSLTIPEHKENDGGLQLPEE